MNNIVGVDVVGLPASVRTSLNKRRNSTAWNNQQFKKNTPIPLEVKELVHNLSNHHLDEASGSILPKAYITQFLQTGSEVRTSFVA